MPFDPTNDKIAITVPRLTLNKESLGEGFDPLFELGLDGIYNEPYFVSLAIDAHGAKQRSLEFNYAEFPKVRKGDVVEMIGDGSLVYGPKNPGDFVAIGIAVFERDEDVRDFGKILKNLIDSKATELGLKAFLAANPGATAIANILRELLKLISATIAQNKDDFLLRTEGVFLRDTRVPYQVNRQFHRENEYVGIDVKVIPLEQANGQGPETRALNL